MHILESMLLGALAAAGALVVELLILTTDGILDVYTTDKISSTYTDSLNSIFVLTVIIEEILKFIVITKRVKYFSNIHTMIVNTAFTGIGFAFIELLLITNKTNITLNKETIGIVLIHTLTACMMGHMITKQKSAHIIEAIKIIALASLIHLLYNATILYNNPFLNSLLIVIFIIVTFIIIKDLFKIDGKLAED